MRPTLSSILALSLAVPAAAAEAPSRYGVDAPELAPLGAYAVGVRTLHLRQGGQVSVLEFDAATGKAPVRDRMLEVELWYPAKPPGGAVPVTYAASLPGEPPRPAAPFTVPGIAVRDAPPAGSRFPLVVVSHGYSGDPVAMTWLSENLASKGYVVAGIRHGDPPITDLTRLPEVLLRRPLDVAFVAQTLPGMFAAERLIDPARIALVGFSMGGYGVLSVAGAALDPQGGAVQLVPGGLLAPYARGGALESSLRVAGLRAVVAMAPYGGGRMGAWGAAGLETLRVPALLIAGDHDRTVDYASGARALFDQAVHAPRYLLTFAGGGHSIGMNPAPQEMRARLWDQDWFEDPVWRKERLNAIEAHFISAFLDRYVKDDASRAAYLEVPVAHSSEGAWPADVAPTAYEAVSPGAPPVTVWKGFQRKHAEGLSLLRADPLPADPLPVDPKPAAVDPPR